MEVVAATFVFAATSSWLEVGESAAVEAGASSLETRVGAVVEIASSALDLDIAAASVNIGKEGSSLVVPAAEVASSVEVGANVSVVEADTALGVEADVCSVEDGTMPSSLEDGIKGLSTDEVVPVSEADDVMTLLSLDVGTTASAIAATPSLEVEVAGS